MKFIGNLFKSWITGMVSLMIFKEEHTFLIVSGALLFGVISLYFLYKAFF